MYIRPKLIASLATLIALMSQSYDPDAALALQAVSPEVNPDRTVTFRLHAPQAKSVKLQGNVPEVQGELEKSSKGLWSITVGPLEPNLYPYHFSVDGTRVIDPLNRHTKAWILSENLVEVSGEDDTDWELTDVPPWPDPPPLVSLTAFESESRILCLHSAGLRRIHRTVSRALSVPWLWR